MKKNIPIVFAIVCLLFSLTAFADPEKYHENSRGYWVTSQNPRSQTSDGDQKGFKAEFKEISDWVLGEYSPMVKYNTIIPKTPNHGCWILGILLTENTFQNLQTELQQTLQNYYSNTTIHVISMIDDNEAGGWYSKLGYIFHRLRWFDHGTLNTETGKNETIESMREFQGRDTTSGLYNDFFAKVPEVNSLFYCHCMAGKSRSLLETMAFIFFYPGKDTLFDFNSYEDKWKEISFGDKPEDLKSKLLDNPSFTDINEFVRLQRYEAKELLELDGDQPGLVGLMSLSKWAGSPELIEKRKLERLYIDAQDIGLMLKAPLDRGFRDPGDIEQQVANLVKVYNFYKAYKVKLPGQVNNKDEKVNIYHSTITIWEDYHANIEQPGINLLMAMIERNGFKKNIEEGFDNNFGKLSPSEQMHFAILMKRLINEKCDLSPLKKTPEELAEIACKNNLVFKKNEGKLTAGDRVEYLRALGEALDTTNYWRIADEAIDKIVSGNLIDQYNAGIQLAELYIIAKKKEDDNKVAKIIPLRKIPGRGYGLKATVTNLVISPQSSTFLKSISDNILEIKENIKPREKDNFDTRKEELANQSQPSHKDIDQPSKDLPHI